jgi:hypothetical protein
MANWHEHRIDLPGKIAVYVSVTRGGLQPKRSGKRPRKDGESGAPVPADPGPKPVPLEGGAEAPLD